MIDLTFEEGVRTLRAHLDQLQSGADNIGYESRAAKPEVIGKYAPIFAPDHISALTAEEFKSFLLFKNNRHWGGLYRQASAITGDMELLRTALAILVNENLPITHRLDKLRPANGDPAVKGLGRAVITAILQVTHPEKYGVLNQTAEDGMKSLGLWPSLPASATFGLNYESVNAVLLRVAQEIPTDLWTLDLLWWRVRPHPPTDSGRSEPTATSGVPRSEERLSHPGTDPIGTPGQVAFGTHVQKSLVAFFSYTRSDDEYFGGTITSLRRSLERGVRVATGNLGFTLFQDVDGIEFGQQWKKRLAEAISTSSFFIPILTPLFFTSNSCREELKQFIDHEKSLGRGDLILPIYFETLPWLEDPEQLRKKNDPLASEIALRQRYDWRDQADLPADDPRILPAVRELARKIARAVERT